MFDQIKTITIRMKLMFCVELDIRIHRFQIDSQMRPNCDRRLIFDTLHWMEGRKEGNAMIDVNKLNNKL
jgi:hypothetical protein